MGTIWRAYSFSLGVDVAVKVLRLGAGSGEAERLLREARAAAAIGHPSIVRIFDCGVTDADEPFLVMELLSGESLDRKLDAWGRLAPTTAVELLLPIASALAAAHARGVVHRDIKPENIVLVQGDGGLVSPTLVDFGIAKLADNRGGRVLTEAGALLGSPGYMSPEQARDTADVDARTDIWSFCVLLYELVVGRRPFDSPNMSAVLVSIFRDDPTPITVYMTGDEALWAIIERGLRKAPEERWPGMRELGQALARWAIARGVVADAAGVSIERQWFGGRADPASPEQPSPGSMPEISIHYRTATQIPRAASPEQPSPGSMPEISIHYTSATQLSRAEVPSTRAPSASTISLPRGRKLATLAGLALSALVGFVATRGAVTAAGDAPPTSPAVVATAQTTMALAAIPEIDVTPMADKPPAREAPAPTATAKSFSSSSTRSKSARRVSMPLPATPDF
jgi:serine/threonine-protein kinase